MLAGFLFVPCAIALLAAGAWSGAVRGLRWYGDRIDERIEASESTVFAPGYSPDPRDKALALRAIHAMELAGPRNSLGETNGMGWSHTPDGTMRLAWLWAVAGNLDHAQAYLSRALHAGKPGEEALQDMSKVLALRTKPPAAWTELLESVTIAQPHAYHARVALGYAEARAGNTDGALAHFRAPFEHVHKATEQELQRGAQGVFSLLGALPPDRAEALAQETLASLEAALPMKPHAADLRVFTATVAVQLDGETLSDATKRKARASLDEAVSFKPRDPSLRLQRAVFLLLVGEAPAAVADLREAVRHQPRNTTIHVQAGDVLAQAGKFAEAAGYYERADALQPGTAAIVERFAQALDQAGDGARAAKIRRGER